MVVSPEMWLSEARLETSAIRVELRRYNFPSPNLVVEEEARPILSLSLPRPEVDGLARFDIAGTSTSYRPLGPILFRPADVPLYAHGSGGAQRILVCEFDPAFFANVTELRDWDLSRLKRCLDVRNPALLAGLRRLGAELRQPGFGTEMLVDAMAVPLMVDLARGITGIHRLQEVRCGGLAEWQLKRIRESFFEADGRWPTTDDLARGCGISRGHLSRNFTQTTGTTLHEFGASIRTLRAKVMLREQAYSIAAIAFRLGFASTSSFSTAFRRATRMTPGEYARQSRALAWTLRCETDS